MYTLEKKKMTERHTRRRNAFPKTIALGKFVPGQFCLENHVYTRKPFLQSELF